MEDGTDPRDRATGWQLEGSSAEAYERFLVPGMFAPWADVLVDRTAVQPGDRVLDVGCGTGIVARRAAPMVAPDGAVVGLDPNEGMLAVARTATQGEAESIEWRRGEAAEIPFPDGSFDVVVSQQALQFVTDPAAAFREIRRVLDPDGRVGLAVWRPIEFNRIYATVADALERHVSDEAAAMMRSPFSSWDVSELRGIVREAGFPDVTVTIGIGSMRYPSAGELIRRESASSPLAGPLAALSRDARDALVEDVGEALDAYTDDEGIVVPMETFLVTALP